MLRQTVKTDECLKQFRSYVILPKYSGGLCHTTFFVGDLQNLASLGKTGFITISI